MIQGIPHEGIKIRAYDFETREFVGEYDSMSQATRRLFIKHKSYIHIYLYGHKGCTFKQKKRGVKSYKDGKVYHFEAVK